MESSSGYSEKKGKVRKKNKKIKSSEVFYEIIQFYLIVLFLYSNSRDFALLFVGLDGFFTRKIGFLVLAFLFSALLAC